MPLHAPAFLKRTAVLSLLVLILAASGCSPARVREYSRTVALMGTFVQIKVPAADVRDEASFAALTDGAIGLADRLEKKLSIYDPESEVNALNKAKRIKASRELFEVLSLSTQVSERTGGAFDITVVPILKEKGFYNGMPREIRDSIPPGTGGVGWRNVEINADDGTVGLANGAWVDLSGVAAGYIVDRIADHLGSEGVRSYLVNGGGEIRCGAKRDGKKWRVGIQRPGRAGTIVVLELVDAAVATSGDYENFIVDDDGGKGMSHIIDPAKAEPMNKELSSVTVITQNCAYADALGTAMMVMGREKAMALADGLTGVGVIFVETVDGKEKLSFSKGAERFVAK